MSLGNLNQSEGHGNVNSQRVSDDVVHELLQNISDKLDKIVFMLQNVTGIDEDK